MIHHVRLREGKPNHWRLLPLFLLLPLHRHRWALRRFRGHRDARHMTGACASSSTVFGVRWGQSGSSHNAQRSPARSMSLSFF